MRTNSERQQLIHERTRELKIERRQRKQRMIAGVSGVICLAIIIATGIWLPEVMKKSESGIVSYHSGVASMLGNYDALGYICIGILAFALGVCVTVLMYRLQKADRHRQQRRECEKEHKEEE